MAFDSKENYLFLIGCLCVTCAKLVWKFEMIGEMQLRSRRLGLEFNYSYFVCSCMKLGQSLKKLLSLKCQRSFPRAFLIAHKTWMNLVKDYPPIVVFGWRKYHFTVKNVGSVPFIFWELLRWSGKITNSIIYTLQFKRHEVIRANATNTDPIAPLPKRWVWISFNQFW